MDVILGKQAKFVSDIVPWLVCVHMAPFNSSLGCKPMPCMGELLLGGFDSGGTCCLKSFLLTCTHIGLHCLKLKLGPLNCFYCIPTSFPPQPDRRYLCFQPNLKMEAIESTVFTMVRSVSLISHHRPPLSSKLYSLQHTAESFELVGLHL